MTRMSFPGAPDEIPMLTLGWGKQETCVGFPDGGSYLVLDMVKQLTLFRNGDIRTLISEWYDQPPNNIPVGFVPLTLQRGSGLTAGETVK